MIATKCSTSGTNDPVLCTAGKGKHCTLLVHFYHFQAHGLLNSCLIRCDEEDKQTTLQLKIFKLEKSWYNGNHPLQTPEALQELTISLKTRLSNIRAECKRRFEAVGGTISEFDVQDVFSEHNKQQMQSFAAQVNVESQLCTEFMIGFAKLVCETSESIVGRPNDSYAAVALGSIARNEATPFSDLEYAFVVGSTSEKSLLRQLAVDTYFRISNLGETPLKYLYIEELYDNYGREGEKRWFEDLAMSGFKIDGLTPKAGNIPTGNGLSENELILTVEELTEQYRHCLEGNLDEGNADKVGDLSDLLASIVIIHTANNGEELLSEFQVNKMTTDEEIHDRDGGRETLEKKRVRTLLQDVDKFRFCSDVGKLKVDMRKAEVKASIFRYPTILAHDLKILLGYTDCETAWEVYSALQRDNIISEETMNLFQFLVMSAIWTRTLAYLVGGAQREYLSFHPKFDMISPDERFFIPKPLYIIMACRLVPLKQSILHHLARRPPSTQTVTDSLRQIDIRTVHFLTQSRIHYYCNDVSGSLQVLLRALGAAATNNLSNLQAAVQTHGIPHEDLADVVLLTIFQNGYYDLTIQLCNHLCNYEGLKEPNTPHLKLAYYQAIKGQSLMMQGLYDEQAAEFEKAGKSLVHHFGKNKTDAFFHVLSLLSQSGGTPDEREALQRLTTLALDGLCVNLRFVSDSVRHHEGRFEKSMESLQKLLNSYNWVKALGIKENHNSLMNADFKLSIGVYYLQFGDYYTAETYFHEADDIYKKITGHTAASVELSTITLYLGYIKFKRGDYTGARELRRDSLDILNTSEQGSPAHYITNHQILAEVHIAMCRYENASTNIAECLRILHEEFNDRPILSKAVVLITQAQLIYKETRDSSLSPEQKSSRLQPAFDLAQDAIVILQNTVNKKHVHSHPDIALSYKILGQICLEMNHIDQALGYFLMAEEGLIIAYDGENRPQIDLADTLYWSGLTKLRLNEVGRAQQSINKAINMMERIFGVGQHPVTDQYRATLLDIGPAPDAPQYQDDDLD